jgi:hypothetical protein
MTSTVQSAGDYARFPEEPLMIGSSLLDGLYAKDERGTSHRGYILIFPEKSDG